MQLACPIDPVSGSVLSGQRAAAWSLLFLFLLLAGCSKAEAPVVDPQIFAQDSVLDTLQRLFMPKTYWSKRIEQLQRSVDAARAEFHKQHAAYRQLLTTRRQIALTNLNKSERKDPQQQSAAAWREAIRTTRSDLERLRQQSRQAGQALQQQTLWLNQAELSLNHAMW
ncbi:MAG: hypothetical protein HQL63_04090 [Magnetococcales bacterium]|nr:hypothetical protein [Magnetococcales bacterium]